MFGDWGLGIGDWAIPNPQSPIPILINFSIIYFVLFIIYNMKNLFLFNYCYILKLKLIFNF